MPSEKLGHNIQDFPLFKKIKWICRQKRKLERYLYFYLFRVKSHRIQCFHGSHGLKFYHWIFIKALLPVSLSWGAGDAQHSLWLCFLPTVLPLPCSISHRVKTFLVCVQILSTVSNSLIICIDHFYIFFFYLETFNLLPKVLDSREQPLPSKFFKIKEAWKANFVSNNSTVAWVYFYIETCFVNSSFSVCSLSAFAFLGRRPRSSEGNKAWFLHMKWRDRQLQLCLEKLAEVILLPLDGQSYGSPPTPSDIWKGWIWAESINRVTYVSIKWCRLPHYLESYADLYDFLGWQMSSSLLLSHRTASAFGSRTQKI